MAEESRGARILIVDAQEANLRALEEILSSGGFSEIRGVTDPRRVLSQMREFHPDILLLNLDLPHLDGFDILRQVRHRVARSEYFPALVISGDLSEESKLRALEEGARDFAAPPYDPVDVITRVRNLLEIRELTRRLNQRDQGRGGVRTSELGLAERLAPAAEFRGRGRGFHSERVGHIAGMIAAELDLPDAEVELIRRAAPLHDIGMIGIPDAIVLKPDQLTLEEWDVLKTHTVLGSRILGGSDSPVLQVGEEIALYHHENWDGTGYTPGLGEEEIPLPSRITAVADVFDALTHERPYDTAWPVENAVEWIGEQKGRKFDPMVVSAFLRTDPWSLLPRLDEAAGEPGLLEPLESNYAQVAPGG